MPHPYYQLRQSHRHLNSSNYTTERLSDRARVRRRSSFSEHSRIPSGPFRGGPPKNPENRSRHSDGKASANMSSGLPSFWHAGYPYSAVPTQFLHGPPLHPLHYASPISPLIHPIPYVLTSVVPTHHEPCRTLRPKRSAVKLPPTTRVPGPAQSGAATTTAHAQHLPRSPRFSTFNYNNPGSTSYGLWQTTNAFSEHARNLIHDPEAWDGHCDEQRTAEVPYPLPVFGYVLPFEMIPAGLVLPRAEDSQMNWPPKDVKLERKQWMIHPCLLWVENEIVQTSWKWDMSKYPTRGSILGISPRGIVYPIEAGDLGAPIIHSPMNQKIKLIVNDFSLQHLEFSSNELTVGSLFLAVWEFLNQHLRNDWQSWLTKRNLQYVIPVLEANRNVRLKNIGKLAAMAEVNQSPKWIDAFGDLVFFGGLIPLINADPREETKVFKLRHRGWD